MTTEQKNLEQIDVNINNVTAIVLAYAGSDNLRRQMNKIHTDYVKVCKGAKVSYILRGKNKKSPIYNKKLIIVL